MAGNKTKLHGKLRRRFKIKFENLSNTNEIKLNSYIKIDIFNLKIIIFKKKNGIWKIHRLHLTRYRIHFARYLFLAISHQRSYPYPSLYKFLSQSLPSFPRSILRKMLKIFWSISLRRVHDKRIRSIGVVKWSMALFTSGSLKVWIENNTAAMFRSKNEILRFDRCSRWRKGKEAEGERDREKKKITSVTERNRIQRRRGWLVGRFTR